MTKTILYLACLNCFSVAKNDLSTCDVYQEVHNHIIHVPVDQNNNVPVPEGM